MKQRIKWDLAEPAWQMGTFAEDEYRPYVLAYNEAWKARDLEGAVELLRKLWAKEEQDARKTEAWRVSP